MEDIVQRLRAHPSRDNRALLDEAADKIEHLREITKMMDNELANHKHAEDAYITIIDKLKRRIEHECVAWHSAEEWPDEVEFVVAVVSATNNLVNYEHDVCYAYVDHKSKRFYGEDFSDITAFVKWWCYEPEWSKEDEE